MEKLPIGTNDIGSECGHRSPQQQPKPLHCCTNIWEAEIISLDSPRTPPYSPDLSPCDYHLFVPLKEALGGQRFDDDTGVEELVASGCKHTPCLSSRKEQKKCKFVGKMCFQLGDYIILYFLLIIFCIS